MPDVTTALSHDWATAIFMVGVLLMCVFMVGAASVLGGRAWGRSKNEPFESGIVATGSARIRLSAKFYLVAMLFVIFDVEALYLFAWAVSLREGGWAGFVEAAVFICILLVGLCYLLRVGAIDWSPRTGPYTGRKVSNNEVR